MYIRKEIFVWKIIKSNNLLFKKLKCMWIWWKIVVSNIYLIVKCELNYVLFYKFVSLFMCVW